MEWTVAIGVDRHTDMHVRERLGRSAGSDWPRRRLGYGRATRS
jgi:hypothetical protein